MAATRLKEGQEVWVKDAGIAHEDLFALGHVVSIDGHKVRVETRHHGKSQEITVLDEECFHTNNGARSRPPPPAMAAPCTSPTRAPPPTAGADVPDHCQLVYLSQPTLLENTRLRFEDDKIYTYVGDILVAVNPFKWIAGLYTETNMAACKGKKLANAECGPHVYSISEKVCRLHSSSAPLPQFPTLLLRRPSSLIRHHPTPAQDDPNSLMATPIRARPLVRNGRVRRG